jgi:hypothetical protein
MPMNDAPVQDVSGFNRQLEQNAGRSVALLVRRGDALLYVPLKVPG